MTHHAPAQRPLRVALPMVNLVPGGMGGSETYATELVNGLAALPHEVDVAVGLPESASGFTTRARVAVAARVKGGGTALARVGSQMAAEVSPTLLGVMRGSDIVHYPLTVPSPRPPRGIPYIRGLLDTRRPRSGPQTPAPLQHCVRRLRYGAAPRRPTGRDDAITTLPRREFRRRPGRSPLESTSA